jgi:hypothetical protein
MSTPAVHPKMTCLQGAWALLPSAGYFLLGPFVAGSLLVVQESLIQKQPPAWVVWMAWLQNACHYIADTLASLRFSSSDCSIAAKEQYCNQRLWFSVSIHGHDCILFDTNAWAPQGQWNKHWYSCINGMGNWLPIMPIKHLTSPLGWDRQRTQHNGQSWACSITLTHLVNDYDI